MASNVFLSYRILFYKIAGHVANILKNAPLTALCAQAQIKKSFESIAWQRFQNFSCGSFDR
jgi:hypothetical protein